MKAKRNRNAVITRKTYLETWIRSDGVLRNSKLAVVVTGGGSAQFFLKLKIFPFFFRVTPWLKKNYTDQHVSYCGRRAK